MTDEKKDKKEILKELLLTEEDTLKKLRVLINKTKAIIKIDQKTTKIVLSSDYKYKIAEKILLYLIGKYFCKELGLCEKEGLDLQEMEIETGIKKTTLSKPLGGLIYSGYIGQDIEKKYFVHHYKIEEVVHLIHDIYIDKNLKTKPLSLKYKTPEKHKKGEKDG